MSWSLQTVCFAIIGIVCVTSISLEDLVDDKYSGSIRQAIFVVSNNEINKYDWHDSDPCLALIKLAAYRLQMLDRNLYLTSSTQRTYEQILIDVIMDAAENVGKKKKQKQCKAACEAIVNA
uniref:Uncharacterized protein n=1 Tax=Trichuris muris TaxID=70415 RepID=A0A5S6QJS5_TRIMR